MNTPLYRIGSVATALVAAMALGVAGISVAEAGVRTPGANALQVSCNYVLATASPSDTLSLSEAHLFAESPAGCAGVGNPNRLGANTIPQLMRALIAAPMTCPKGWTAVGAKQGGVIDAGALETRSFITRRQYVMHFTRRCVRNRP